MTFALYFLHQLSQSDCQPLGCHMKIKRFHDCWGGFHKIFPIIAKEKKPKKKKNNFS